VFALDEQESVMEKWSLTALADGLLSHALTASSGRGTRTVNGGHPNLLHQAVIALAHGQRLDENDNPGEVTVQVLRGRIRITAGDDAIDGSPGQLLIVPRAPYTVTALEDAVLLLTVAKPTTPIAPDPVPAPAHMRMPAREFAVHGRNVAGR
jgi:quercetin dioxygenase-like cupin family protein